MMMTEECNLQKLSRMIHLSADTMRLICERQAVDGEVQELVALADELDRIGVRASIVADQIRPRLRMQG